MQESSGKLTTQGAVFESCKAFMRPSIIMADNRSMHDTIAAAFVRHYADYNHFLCPKIYLRIARHRSLIFFLSHINVNLRTQQNAIFCAVHGRKIHDVNWFWP